METYSKRAKNVNEELLKVIRANKNRFPSFLKSLDNEPYEIITNEYYTITKKKTGKLFVIKSKKGSTLNPSYKELIFQGSISVIDKTGEMLDQTNLILNNIKIKENEQIIFYPLDPLTTNHLAKVTNYLVFKLNFINDKINKI